jgi:hypothetical protein
MNVLFVAFPNHPLLPPNVEIEKNKKPNRKNKQKKELLLSSIPFFLSSSFAFDFLYLDSFAFSEIISKKPEIIIMDISFFKELGEDYLNNYYRIVQKIKETIPYTKIITISNKENKDCQNLFVYDIKDKEKTVCKKFKKYLKNLKIKFPESSFNLYNIVKEKFELCVVQDLMCFSNHIEIYKHPGLDFFYFFNYTADFDFDLLSEISYRIELSFEDMTSKNLEILPKTGCVEIICLFNLNEKNKIELQNKIKIISQIKNKLNLKFKIIPECKNNKNLIDVLNLLDYVKIDYQITKNQDSDSNQNILFSLVECFKDCIPETKDLKKRLTLDIYSISQNITLENLVNAIFELDNQYMDIYLDLIHLFDGYFTTEEIIGYLIKLHPRHTKEEIDSETQKCILFLEKKKLITKDKDYQTKPKLNNNFKLKSVLPQRTELQLLYSGSEKGYFMINTKLKLKDLEKISKDLFFFFIFSKGIYYIREVSEKLHLILGDCVEFSKDNYIKTTGKIYQTLKRYKLCK